MKRFILAMLAFLVLLIGLVVPTTTAQAHPNPYNGITFSGIPCFDNNIGTTWNIMGAAYYFEAGGLTIADGAQQAGCDFWSPNNVVRFSVYSASDQQCIRVTSSSLLADPDGGYWWNANVHVQMNIHYPQCQDTLQNRNNRISQAIGYALGLLIYWNPSEPSIMCRYNEEIYNFAGTLDRARIDAIY